MNKAALQRDGHRVRAVSGIELLEDALEMRLHRFAGAADGLGDLFVAESLGHELNHFQLAGGEIRSCEFGESLLATRGGIIRPAAPSVWRQ